MGLEQTGGSQGSVHESVVAEKSPAPSRNALSKKDQLGPMTPFHDRGKRLTGGDIRPTCEQLTYFQTLLLPRGQLFSLLYIATNVTTLTHPPSGG